MPGQLFAAPESMTATSQVRTVPRPVLALSLACAGPLRYVPGKVVSETRLVLGYCLRARSQMFE